MLYKYELTTTRTDYATKTRKYKPSVSKISIPIVADNPVIAEDLIRDYVTKNYPDKIKREVVLSGYCKIIDNGRIIDEYDYDAAFLIDTTDDDYWIVRKPNGIIRLY